MSNIDTVIRYREALHTNVEKIAKHYNEDAKGWLSYITNFVEENHGLLIPMEQYRLMYNKSVEILNDIIYAREGYRSMNQYLGIDDEE